MRGRQGEIRKAVENDNEVGFMPFKNRCEKEVRMHLFLLHGQFIMHTITIVSK